MSLPSVMFCGAADTRPYLDIYFNICRSLNLEKPINFINGTFSFNQFGGPNAYELNSERTIDDSDLLVFVIKEDFGRITWEVEFEYAVERGKNFIILCHQLTYDRYKLSTPAQLAEDILLSKIAYLEVYNRYNQFSIIAFEETNLESMLINQISQLFSIALKSHEEINRRKSFINKHLYGSKFANYKSEDINDKNEKLCSEILFDPFEVKEIRKRAMEFFVHRKSLTQEQIITLCNDPEQGIARKTMSRLSELVDREKVNLGEVYESVIHSIVIEGEVGIIRRCIKSLSEVGILFAMKYLPMFFPSDDIGTPKRIVRLIKENWDELQDYRSKGLISSREIRALLVQCLSKDGNKGEWKDVANGLINDLGPDEPETE